MSISSVCAQEPVIDRITADVLSPGQTATLTVHGQNLAGTLAVWTSFGQFKPASSYDPENDKQTIVQALIPEQVDPGIYPARVVTGRGVASEDLVIVDSLPHVTVDPASETPGTGQTIPVRCSLNGHLNPLKSRYFSLDLEQNETIVVEVLSRRTHSQLDPVLRLTTEDGREIAFADDTPGLSGDALIEFTAPASGRYLLEVRDVKYGGSAKHFFHLRVGHFSPIVAALPRIVSADSSSEAILSDGSVRAARASTDGISSGKAGLIESVLSAQDEEHSDTGFTRVLQSTRTLQLESEPNNDRQSATAVEQSAARLAGRFNESGDTDWYQLSGAAGEKVVLTTHTRDVESPADVVLSLWDAAGKKLSEVDDSGTADAQLLATFPEDGQCFLAVSDITAVAYAASTYDIDIDRGGRLDVTASTDHVTVPLSGSASLPIAVKRIGLAGPVTITVAGLPENLHATPVYLAANQKSAVMTITNNGSAKSAFGPMTLTASSGDSESHFSATLAAPAANSAAFRLHRLTSDLFVATKPVAEISLTAEPAQVTLAPGTSQTVTLNSSRLEGWSQPIEIAAVFPKELPTGITVSAAKIEQSSIAITLAADATVQPGKYSIFLQGTIKKDKATVTQPVPTITVVVPLEE